MKIWFKPGTIDESTIVGGPAAVFRPQSTNKMFEMRDSYGNPAIIRIVNPQAAVAIAESFFDSGVLELATTYMTALTSTGARLEATLKTILGEWQPFIVQAPHFLDIDQDWAYYCIRQSGSPLPSILTSGMYDFAANFPRHVEIPVTILLDGPIDAATNPTDSTFFLRDYPLSGWPIPDFTYEDLSGHRFATEDPLELTLDTTTTGVKWRRREMDIV